MLYYILRTLGRSSLRTPSISSLRTTKEAQGYRGSARAHLPDVFAKTLFQMFAIIVALHLCMDMFINKEPRRALSDSIFIFILDMYYIYVFEVDDKQ